MNSEKYSDKITIYGSVKEIAEAKQRINAIKHRLTNEEGKDRLLLQREIVDNIKGRILYDGNSVYSKTKLIKQFKTLLKNGMQSLTNDLYHFFSLCCGSIAHYDKNGWICEYPDLYALKEFFKHNEFGRRVLDDQPSWATDRIEIIKEMERLLCLSADEINSQKDKDTEHKLDVLEKIVKAGRKDKKAAGELVDKVFIVRRLRW